MKSLSRMWPRTSIRNLLLSVCLTVASIPAGGCGASEAEGVAGPAPWNAGPGGSSQPLVLDTIAGQGVGDGHPATAVPLRDAEGVAVDGLGNLYIADSSSTNSRVRRVDRSGVISTVAGGGLLKGLPPALGDGGPATEGILIEPRGLAVDEEGALFVADSGNGRVRKITREGIITTVAGGGSSSADEGPALSMVLQRPIAIALGHDGRLYIVTAGAKRVRVLTADGLLRTVTASGPFAGILDVLAPLGVAEDADGNVYIAGNVDVLGGKGVLLKVDPAGMVTVVTAGDGAWSIAGVAADKKGNVFVIINSSVGMLSPDGSVRVVAGGFAGYSGDGGPAIGAGLSAKAVAADEKGNLFIAEGTRVREVDDLGIITTVAGNGTRAFFGDGGPAREAAFAGIGEFAVDAWGNIFVPDGGNGRVRKIDAGGVISTVAGGGERLASGDEELATDVILNGNSLVLGDDGEIYIASPRNDRVWMVDAKGILSTVAGGADPEAVPDPSSGD